MSNVLNVKGPDGSWHGIPAIQGPRGERGPIGPQGDIGPTGPKGADGFYALKDAVITTENGVNYAQLFNSAINALTLNQDIQLRFPDKIEGLARDFIINLAVTSESVMTPPPNITLCGSALEFSTDGDYLITLTEIAVDKFYVKVIGVA